MEYIEQDLPRANAALAAIFAQIKAGRLSPLPRRDFSLESAGDAFHFLQSAKHVGKVLLTAGKKQTDLNGKTPTEKTPTIRLGAAYVISGGLGGLGFLVAKYLAEQKASHIVLLGREEPSTEQFQQIHQWESLGAKILPLRCDVANLAEVESALNTVRRSVPIAGIVHSAGILSDASLANQTEETFRAVFDPKVRGAWNLHLASQQDRLDHFVLFSSVAGELGSPGQINHAAANTFLDSLAAYRQSEGLPALSMVWGPWGDVGAAIQNGRLRHAQAAAFELISPAEGIQSFATAIRHERESSLTMMKFDPSRLPQEFAGRSIFLSLQAPKKPAVESVRSPKRLDVQNLPASEAAHAIRDYLKQKVATILCFEDAEQVDLEAALFDLGLDSLTTLEFQNALQTDLGLTLKASIFFDHPTLKDLAAYLLKSLHGSNPTNRSEEASVSKELPAVPRKNNAAPTREAVNRKSAANDSVTRNKLMEISKELSKWDDIPSD